MLQRQLVGWPQGGGGVNNNNKMPLLWGGWLKRLTGADFDGFDLCSW